MTDREHEGYKGLVREAVLDRPFATSRFFVWFFDREGNLVQTRYREADGKEHIMHHGYDDTGNRIGPVSIEQLSNGHYSWQELKDLPRAPSADWAILKPEPLADKFTDRQAPTFFMSAIWNPLPLPLRELGLGFPNRGAGRVRARFDLHGVPTEISFFNRQNRLVARVDLIKDDRGNIVEAATYGGVEPVLKLAWYERALMSRENKAALGYLLEPNALESRTLFKYDSNNNVIETQTVVSGEVVQQTTFTYNAHGDKSTVQENGMPAAVFEYKYDEFDNWTLQIVQYAGGSYESKRLITYYE